MGIFSSIGRLLGPVPTEELDRQREAVRQRYLAADNVDKATRLYNRMHAYDEQLNRRANKAYDRENPNPPEPRHREHGWYLPSDD